MRERGAVRADVCGMAGRVVFPSESGGVWEGKEVLIKHCLESGVVAVLVDAKMNKEPVLRGSSVG